MIETRITTVVLCFYALLLVLALSGCDLEANSPPADDLCAGACVGPYDLGLRSHRQALGLQ